MKKNFKVLSLIAIGSSLVIGTVALSATGVLKNQIFPAIGNGETVTKGEIEFLPENAKYSGSTTTITGYTVASHTPIICKITGNNTDVDYSGKVGACFDGTEIHFYESDGVTEYTFEEFYGLTLYYDSDQTSKHTFTLKGLFNDGRVVDKHYNTSASTARFLNYDYTGYGPVSNFYLVSDNVASKTAKLNKLKVTYSCTTKSLVDISLEGTPRTEYVEGESFDTTGLMLDLEYSNGTHIKTQVFSVSPSVLSINDQYVTIGFGGFTVQQEISVVEAITALSGRYNTYNGTDVSAFFDFDENYYSRSGVKVYFTYEIVGFTVTFTKGDGTQTGMIGTYWLFKNGETTNSTSTLSGSTSFSITLYSSTGGTTSKTFTKA